MTVIQRTLLVIVLMTVGLVALVVDNVDSGWTALGVIGAACFALGIAAEFVVLSRAKPRA